MAKYWWQEDDDEEDEEDQNTSARKIYLETKNINEQTLAKRFNDIVAAQSLTTQSKMFALSREYKDCLRKVKAAQKNQLRLGTYVDVWNGFLYNVKTFGFFEAKERVQIDICPLENATREVDIWRRWAYDQTLGMGPDVIKDWVESYSKTIQRHKDLENEAQKIADEKQREYEQLEKTLQNNVDPELKGMVSSFVSDYKRFELAYPESAFVKKLGDMVQGVYRNRNVGEGTIFQLANRIAYGMLANVFAEGRKDEGEGR